MMKGKGLTGWVVAGVLALALGGVLIYETTSGGDSKTAAIGGQGQGQGPPPDVAADVSAILAAKNAAGKDRLPTIPPGQKPTDLPANPPQHCDPNGEPNVFAEWRNTPVNLNQAAGLADEIVVGTAETVEAAQPLNANASGEPGGSVETPVQNITIRVDQTVKGKSRAGGVVTIQRLGDAAGCYRVDGEPPYERGQQYLLLLENGAGGRPPHPISPEGRYHMRAGGVLEAVSHSPAAEEAAGQTLEKVLAKLR